MLKEVLENPKILNIDLWLAYKATSPRGLSNNIPKGHTDDLGFEIVADVGLAPPWLSGLTGDATSLTVDSNHWTQF